MDPQLVEVTQLFERFKAALVRSDFGSCNNLLSQLKGLAGAWQKYSLLQR